MLEKEILEKFKGKDEKDLPTLDQALRRAAAFGTQEDIQALIQFGANINDQDLKKMYTPLHRAILHDKIANAIKLIELHANLTLRDIDEQTPYMLAKRTNNLKLIELLEPLSPKLILTATIVELIKNEREVVAVDLTKINKDRVDWGKIEFLLAGEMHAGELIYMRKNMELIKYFKNLVAAGDYTTLFKFPNIRYKYPFIQSGIDQKKFPRGFDDLKSDTLAALICEPSIDIGTFLFINRIEAVKYTLKKLYSEELKKDRSYCDVYFYPIKELKKSQSAVHYYFNANDYSNLLFENISIPLNPVEEQYAVFKHVPADFCKNFALNSGPTLLTRYDSKKKELYLFHPNLVQKHLKQCASSLKRIHYSYGLEFTPCYGKATFADQHHAQKAIKQGGLGGRVISLDPPGKNGLYQFHEFMKEDETEVSEHDNAHISISNQIPIEFRNDVLDILLFSLRECYNLRKKGMITGLEIDLEDLQLVDAETPFFKSEIECYQIFHSRFKGGKTNKATPIISTTLKTIRFIFLLHQHFNELNVAKYHNKESFAKEMYKNNPLEKALFLDFAPFFLKKANNDHLLAVGLLIIDNIPENEISFYEKNVISSFLIKNPEQVTLSSNFTENDDPEKISDGRILITEFKMNFGMHMLPNQGIVFVLDHQDSVNFKEGIFKKIQSITSINDHGIKSRTKFQCIK